MRLLNMSRAAPFPPPHLCLCYSALPTAASTGSPVRSPMRHRLPPIQLFATATDDAPSPLPLRVPCTSSGAEQPGEVSSAGAFCGDAQEGSQLSGAFASEVTSLFHRHFRWHYSCSVHLLLPTIVCSFPIFMTAVRTSPVPRVKSAPAISGDTGSTADVPG